MRTRTFAIAIAALAFLVPPSFACSCANNIPIQRSVARYTRPDEAVFTARVVGLLGKIYLWEGKRQSSQVLAIVHQRHWGLPVTWPKVVLLDGSYPCDIAMEEGQEYLVAGRRSRYGVVAVNGCSRTQPLKTAQLDLRTLDGTHCQSPGGTFIGHVLGEWDEHKRDFKAAEVPSVNLIDIDGNSHQAAVDANSIYELQHLPNSFYAPDSLLDDHRFLSSPLPSYFFGVSESACEDLTLIVRDYQLTGRLLPGIGESVTVRLRDVKDASKIVPAYSIEPDGRFYFRNIPHGEYALAVTSTVDMAHPTVFYPGVSQLAKAKRILIDGHQIEHSYDFAPSVLPVVPIRFHVENSPDSSRFAWGVELLVGAAMFITSSVRLFEANTGIIYGPKVANQLRLRGYPHDPTDSECLTAPVQVKAASGKAPVRLVTDCVNYLSGK